VRGRAEPKEDQGAATGPPARFAKVNFHAEHQNSSNKKPASKCRFEPEKWWAVQDLNLYLLPELNVLVACLNQQIPVLTAELTIYLHIELTMMCYHGV
jgi:hypothetical protein